MNEKTSQEIKVKAQNAKKKKKKKKKCLALIVHDLGDHSNFLDMQQ